MLNSKNLVMELDGFVRLFGVQFDDTPADVFAPDTKFRDLDEWSSLTALSIIAMVDDELDVQLTGNDVRGANTIEDIFHIVKSRMNGA